MAICDRAPERRGDRHHPGAAGVDQTRPERGGRIGISAKILQVEGEKGGAKTEAKDCQHFRQPDCPEISPPVNLSPTRIETPKNPPRGEIVAGTSPQGHALKFVHRGSYDGLDNTYEAITNFLDDKRLEAKDMFIEQYVTDPLTTNEENLVVNVFVMIK